MCRGGESQSSLSMLLYAVRFEVKYSVNCII